MKKAAIDERYGKLKDDHQELQTSDTVCNSTSVKIVRSLPNSHPSDPGRVSLPSVAGDPGHSATDRHENSSPSQPRSSENGCHCC